MKPISAGKLSARLIFQSRSVATDAIGGSSSIWVDAFGAWAQLIPLAGRALVAAQARNAEVTHEVTIRYRSELADPLSAVSYRIRYGTRTLTVHSAINVDECNKWIVLLCTEGVVKV